METVYIQFEIKEDVKESKKEIFFKKRFKKALIKILKTFIPLANPDFDNKIGNVKYWLVECNLKDGTPQREIGLNKQNQVIMKMPFKDNYGYWTDNNLLLNDFRKHFQVIEITKEIFEHQWKQLE